MCQIERICMLEQWTETLATASGRQPLPHPQSWASRAGAQVPRAPCCHRAFCAPVMRVCAILTCIASQDEQAQGIISIDMSMGLLHAVCHAYTMSACSIQPAVGAPNLQDLGQHCLHDVPHSIYAATMAIALALYAKNEMLCGQSILLLIIVTYNL